MSVLRLVPPKGEAIVVDVDEALVGREASCNVVVLHPSVSRRHALIKRKQGVFFVVDQGSANGTFVDSKRIVDGVLKEGVALRFGSMPFKVEIRDDIREESVTEDELAVPATIVGQQTFAETVVEDGALPEVFEPEEAEPDQSGSVAPAVEDPALAVTVQAPAPRLSEAPSSPPPAAARPAPSVPSPRSEERPRRERPAPPPPEAAAPRRGPGFWLMIAAAGMALLFMGAALGLGAAFLAKRLGWL